MALAMGKLFRADDAKLRASLASIWKHMVEVGAICASLAAYQRARSIRSRRC